MINLALTNTSNKRNKNPFSKLGQLLKRSASTLMVAGALALFMGTEAFAQVQGVDAIIQGVATSIMPNFKFATTILAGGLGLCLFIGGLVKTAPRMMVSGAGLAIIPAALWNPVVGTAATVLIG